MKNQSLLADFPIFKSPFIPPCDDQVSDVDDLL